MGYLLFIIIRYLMRLKFFLFKCKILYYTQKKDWSSCLGLLKNPPRQLNNAESKGQVFVSTVRLCLERF